ncbi:hypothetical protein [Neisseria sp.]|uniref:hypothetical protein n=1 Tax=Neisseria sp. TaxID=192066 RepID=UPI0035A00FA2
MLLTIPPLPYRRNPTVLSVLLFFAKGFVRMPCRQHTDGFLLRRVSPTSVIPAQEESGFDIHKYLLKIKGYLISKMDSRLQE